MIEELKRLGFEPVCLTYLSNGLIKIIINQDKTISLYSMKGDCLGKVLNTTELKFFIENEFN